MKYQLQNKILEYMVNTSVYCDATAQKSNYFDEDLEGFN